MTNKTKTNKHFVEATGKRVLTQHKQHIMHSSSNNTAMLEKRGINDLLVFL